MNALESILQSGVNVPIADMSIPETCLCILVSLALGVVIALLYTYKEQHTRSFCIALALIPAITCIVIAMVNGNLGAGVAVAGAFSLVRFRSAPGTGRDIAFVFLAMAIGLITGMGYIVLAATVTAVIGVAYLLLVISPFGRGGDATKTLSISVPESIDYAGMFDDVIASHTTSHRLLSVKTGAMGTVYKLTYTIGSKGPEEDKTMIDDIRCLNGNMEVAVFESPTGTLSEL